MDLKDFVLAVFEEGKKPEEIQGIVPVERLDQIQDTVTLYFVDSVVGTVSALTIGKCVPIDDETVGVRVIEGELELGGYKKSERYYQMGEFRITRLSQDPPFVTQEILDEGKTYMETL